MENDTFEMVKTSLETNPSPQSLYFFRELFLYTCSSNHSIATLLT
jgi:hypothetical protein